ncbi:hypothetical protein Q1695_011777 [Nippostrongylus brasiliensis]|nr:hypothetical protein Q1695_011777 [Nippostrongylus brasiliensis]
MQCEEKRQLVGAFWFLLAMYAQLCASLISSVLCILVMKKCLKTVFHVNIKVLFVAMLSLYVVHSLIIAATQTMHLILYKAKDPCTLSISPVTCFCLRFPAFSCMVSFSVMQFFMVVERMAALWKHQRYESYGPLLGILFVAISILVAIGGASYTFSDYMSQQSFFYCSSISSYSSTRIEIVFFSITGIDLLTVLLIIMLNVVNAHFLKRKSNTLAASYQLRENIVIFRIILPLSTFQALYFLLYSMSGVLLTEIVQVVDAEKFYTWAALLYTPPYYTLISTLFIGYAMRSSNRRHRLLEAIDEQQRKEREIYFQTYDVMWKRHDTKRKNQVGVQCQFHIPPGGDSSRTNFIPC